MKHVLVVTRHMSLVDYAMEIGLIDSSAEVVSHVTAEIVKDRHVLGVLPHSMSCLTLSFTEIPLSLPAELRGTELTIEQLRQYAGQPVTYKVEKVA